jgi:hypothetical protein
MFVTPRKWGARRSDAHLPSHSRVCRNGKKLLWPLPCADRGNRRPSSAAADEHPPPPSPSGCQRRTPRSPAAVRNRGAYLGLRWHGACRAPPREILRGPPKASPGSLLVRQPSFLEFALFLGRPLELIIRTDAPWPVFVDAGFGTQATVTDRSAVTGSRCLAQNLIVQHPGLNQAAIPAVATRHTTCRALRARRG